MKYFIISIIAGMLMLSGCTGVKTVSKGLESEAYLEITGTPDNYPDGVDVNISDRLFFKAVVNKPYANRPKGTVYAIETGTHVITITHNNEVIFKKQVFVGAQETKNITLP